MSLNPLDAIDGTFDVLPMPSRVALNRERVVAFENLLATAYTAQLEAEAPKSDPVRTAPLPAFDDLVRAAFIEEMLGKPVNLGEPIALNQRQARGAEGAPPQPPPAQSHP